MVVRGAVSAVVSSFVRVRSILKSGWNLADSVWLRLPSFVIPSRLVRMRRGVAVLRILQADCFCSCLVDCRVYLTWCFVKRIRLVTSWEDWMSRFFEACLSCCRLLYLLRLIENRGLAVQWSCLEW